MMAMATTTTTTTTTTTILVTQARWKTALVALAALGVSSFLGCALEAAGTANRNPSCAVAPCPAADVSNLGVEIFSASQGAQEFSQLPYDRMTGVFQLETAARVELSGQLILPLELGGVSLKNAALVATRPSRLPGRPPVSYQGSFDNNGFYKLALAPNLDGEVYTIRVSVDSSVLPPLTVNVAIKQSTVLDLKPLTPSATPRVTGTVKNALGLPLVGIEVVGRDPLTNEVVTTRSNTDASGQFELLLGAAGSSGGLLVAASITESLELQRVISLETMTNGPDSALVLQVPALPNPKPQIYTFTGPSPAGIDVPVEGAQIIAKATIKEGDYSEVVAVHSLTGLTDSEGRVSLTLYPGNGVSRTYSIGVVTIGNSGFRTSQFEVQAAPNEGFGVTLTVMRRPEVFGTVLDAFGNPVQGATIEPRQRLSQLAVDAMSLQGLVPATATTDSNGKFIIKLDPGSYDLVVLPKATDALPRHWISDVVVGDALEPVVLTPAQLPQAVRLSGRLIDSQQGGITNVTVRFFNLPKAAQCSPDQAPCEMTARLQAETTTRSDGSIEVILPAVP